MKVMIKIWLLLLAVTGIFVLQQERLGTAVFRHRLKISGEKMLAGQKQIAEFRARADGLGAIRLNLEVYSQEINGNDSYDSLIFRIKEKGAEEWYYQNRYDNILHGPKWYELRDYGFLAHSETIFPFGFPAIDDSRGKIYQVEVESVSGRIQKGFALKQNFSSLYIRGPLPEFIFTKSAAVIDGLVAIPWYNYLLILFLGAAAARQGKFSRPWLNWLALLWLVLVGSVAAYLIFGGSEKLEWGIYMAAGALVIPLAWLLKRFNLTRLQPLFLVTFAGWILWLSLSGSWDLRYLIFLPLNLLAPAVLAYFSVNFPFQPLWQVGLAWLAGAAAGKIKINFKPSTFIIFTTIMFFIIVSVLKSIDYHHYSSWAGAAFDVSHGKRLLVDTPSLYGYLSIQFIAAVLRPFGVSLTSFHYLNMILFSLYFMLAALVIFKLVKNRLLALSTSVIWITLPMIFSYHNVSFPPQIGPLRFGLSLLTIAILVFLPARLSAVFGSIIAAVAVFWSAETAVYIVPAWLAVLVTAAGRQRIKSLTVFAVVTGLIYLWLISMGFSFSRFAEFAGAVQGGVVSLPIPAFGNYYPVVMILILGAVAVVYKWRPLLVFLVVHNLASFSYFVSRSHENNIVNLSGFIILELIAIGQSLRIKKLLTVSFTLFLTLFGFRVFSQALKLDINDWRPVEPTVPVLTVALDQYGLTGRPVALLSEADDTRLLLESGISNTLPFNPAIMNSWLPPGQEYQYIDPAIDKLLPGTVVVTGNTVSGFLAPAWDKILERYQLETVGTDKGLTIYEIRTPRI